MESPVNYPWKSRFILRDHPKRGRNEYLPSDVNQDITANKCSYGVKLRMLGSWLESGKINELGKGLEITEL